ncbi:MAG TPA: non-canonical purine NTP diphosphatase [Saprospiraceae bacterium]|nr:non-canonical purine NTP diphosphatase [Saprospiraceae bacterium]
MEIIFATGNPNKIREVNQILGKTHITIKGLKDIGCTEDIPETKPTIQGNAIQKANYVTDNYQVNCFSEDTGLEVDALSGEPGVNTARYAGQGKDPEANMAKILQKLGANTHRTARFRTVIALNLEGQQHLFEGVCEGTIAYEKTGESGFGYDPIFLPQGYAGKSFAELSKVEKNKISHRGIAVRKLMEFLDRV